MPEPSLAAIRSYRIYLRGGDNQISRSHEVDLASIGGGYLYHAD